jgi:hypothetical protein
MWDVAAARRVARHDNSKRKRTRDWVKTGISKQAARWKEGVVSESYRGYSLKAQRYKCLELLPFLSPLLSRTTIYPYYFLLCCRHPVRPQFQKDGSQLVKGVISGEPRDKVTALLLKRAVPPGTELFRGFMQATARSSRAGGSADVEGKAQGASQLLNRVSDEM